VTEPEALQHRRQILLNQLCKAADEIKRIDDRLSNLLAGNRGQGGAGVA